MQEKMPAGKFKAECLRIMDRVRDSGREVIITKRNIPIAKLVPISKKKQRIVGLLKGKSKTLGDIISPIDEIWNADT